MPTPPLFGDEDYGQAMGRLMLKGRIWRTDAAATLTTLLDALAPTYARTTAAAAQLLTDASPATTLNLLEEWEKSLGLPDPCTPLNPTIEQRQAAVRAKWGARGGQSIAYFTAYAADLGFTITITELSASDYAWQINAPSITSSYFTLGSGNLGDYFWVVGNAEFECRMRQIMPAHTVLTFVYS